ncbi:putative Solute carrier family 46 member 3 [Hypsibius exemplaris]|uniref:Solute carrier family 46 member 3 n=1 Tax=Hypsibius exemplaris TaxID=2072580 RepID=A0A1W0WE00_HYPEX|nr:putative Solute carrier family 46 member 3 [Hypsibius exemplaris]
MAKRKYAGQGIRGQMTIELDEYGPLVESAEEPSEEYWVYHGAMRAGPVIFLYGLANGIYGAPFVELLVHKVCEVHYQFPVEYCAKMEDPHFRLEASQVRKLTSYFQIGSTLLECIPAIILSLFLGSWSDHIGRKKLFFYPFLGFLAAAIWTSFCTAYPFPPSYLLISSALAAVFGGRFIILMAAFSFVGDFTDNAHRSMNNAIIEGSLVVGIHAGSFIGGYTYENVGISAPFVTSVLLNATCVLYVVVFIHDRKATQYSSGCGLTGIFAFENLTASWTMLRRQRTGDNRFHLTLIIVASFISNIAFNGKNAVTQLFLEFEPFHWTIQEYTIFNSVVGLVGSAAVVAFVALFTQTECPKHRYCYDRVHFRIFGYIGYSISTSSWMIIATAAFSHMRLLCTVCIRSVLAERWNATNWARAMALVSVVQSASPLLGSVVFVAIFAHTAAWWSGLCFALGSFMLIIVLAIVAYVDIARRNPIYLH